MTYLLLPAKPCSGSFIGCTIKLVSFDKNVLNIFPLFQHSYIKVSLDATSRFHGNRKLTDSTVIPS